MNEKTSSEGVSDASRIENNAQSGKTELEQDAARRKALALNIVENPLKVSSSSTFYPNVRIQDCHDKTDTAFSQRVSKEQAVLDARAFAESHDLAEHADLFGRAALVARAPDHFADVTQLSEDEQAALRYERDHKWNGPFMLWYSIALCAVGAATQGWDQTGSNGANLSFPQEFGIYGQDWIVGSVNAIIFLTAGLM